MRTPSPPPLNDEPSLSVTDTQVVGGNTNAPIMQPQLGSYVPPGSPLYRVKPARAEGPVLATTRWTLPLHLPVTTGVGYSFTASYQRPLPSRVSLAPVVRL